MVWYPEPVFIASPAGRNRFNVLGALNAVTKEVISVCNHDRINSATVCEILNEISAKNCGIPISVFLDNAKYQRCEFVQNRAKELNIELIFIPAYSPNLNLIERLWKHIKKSCLYSKSYDNYTLFTEAIKNALDDRSEENIKALMTLLTCKFQSFKNVKISTV